MAICQPGLPNSKKTFDMLRV